MITWLPATGGPFLLSLLEAQVMEWQTASTPQRLEGLTCTCNLLSNQRQLQSDKQPCREIPTFQDTHRHEVPVKTIYWGTCDLSEIVKVPKNEEHKWPMSQTWLPVFACVKSLCWEFPDKALKSENLSNTVQACETSSLDFAGMCFEMNTSFWF